MAAPRTIALVEDEEGIRASVEHALRREGYTVESHADGDRAWAAFERGLPDLVILDIVVPGIDGLELCRRLRGRAAALPIVFLTSKDEELDRVLGLEIGADDYLTKPFSVRELTARVKALFRRVDLADRPPEEGRPPVRVGELALDEERHQATWAGRPLDLTVTEFLMLIALARRPGIVKTRQQLMDEGYPHDAYVSERTIDTHVKRLRRKLEAARPGFDAIETVYGVGYRYRPS